jgi:hypothetical protein
MKVLVHLGILKSTTDDFCLLKRLSKQVEKLVSFFMHVSFVNLMIWSFLFSL